MYRQEKIHGIPGESFKTAGSLAPNRSYEVDLQSLIDKIKAEITEHADEEIARLQAVSKDLEESMTEKFVEELVDAKKEIIKAADTEIERIKNAFRS